MGAKWNSRWLGIVTISLFIAAAGLWLLGTGTRRYVLKLSAGDVLGRRHEIAMGIQQEAARRGLRIELVPTTGSKDALALVASGELDTALVQGGLDAEGGRVRQVAVLVNEPLHLFVKPDLLAAGHPGLRYKRLNLSTQGSGTRKVAQQVLEFIGLKPGTDYFDEEHSYAELSKFSTEELPDGIFATSTLPWDLGGLLVRQHGYLLMELPFGAAIALRDQSVRDTLIPAYSYSVMPPVPPVELHTVATPLLVVANHQTPEAAVTRLMEVLFESDFAQHVEIPALDLKRIEKERELPLHGGTLIYLHRNEPIVTGEVIESMENLRSFVVSSALAAFLLWRWYLQRRRTGFQTYLEEVSRIESAARQGESDERVDLAAIRDLRRRLSDLKNDVLRKQCNGDLVGEEQMESLIAHVTDVRQYLDFLALQATRMRAGDR